MEKWVASVARRCRFFAPDDYSGAVLLITRRVADVIAADKGVTLIWQFTGAGAQCSPGEYRLVDRSNPASAFHNFCRLFDHERQRWGWP